MNRSHRASYQCQLQALNHVLIQQKPRSYPFRLDHQTFLVLSHIYRLSLKKKHHYRSLLTSTWGYQHPDVRASARGRHITPPVRTPRFRYHRVRLLHHPPPRFSHGRCQQIIFFPSCDQGPMSSFLPVPILDFVVPTEQPLPQTLPQIFLRSLNTCRATCTTEALIPVHLCRAGSMVPTEMLPHFHDRRRSLIWGFC
jgi:hypothetical protein